MNIEKLAARVDDSRTAELERVLLGSALLVATKDACGTAPQQPRPSYVNPPAPLHFECAVRLFGVVDDQGEGDALAVPEVSGGRWPSHPDGDQPRTFRFDFLVPVAQLRDPPTTESSPVVPEPDDDCRLLGPQIAEPDLVPVRVRQPQVLDLANVGHHTNCR